MLLLTILSVLFAHVIASHQVQEHEIKFSLFNKNVYNVSLTKDNLCEVVDPNEEVRILVHGRGYFPRPDWIPIVTETWRQLGNYNVIQVDWSDVSGLDGDVPIYKANEAAYFLAKLIQRMHKRVGISLDNFHLMGHSLGGHFVGFAGKHIKKALNATLGRITGLDPAVDDFNFDPTSENGIQKTDAFLVPVIHSDDTGLGSRGHIDFYANGGSHPQPGCDTTLCSHFRTCEFFNEALLNPEAFLATKCDSYENYLNGFCDGNDKVSLGGNLLGHEGNYFFTTNAEPPYSKN